MDAELTRRHPRLKCWDYRNPGGYFVTICTHQQRPLFARFEAGRICLKPLGKLAARQWRSLPDHYSNLLLDAFVVMPEHIHALMVLVDSKVGEASLAPTSRRARIAHSLGSVVGGFKSGVTRLARRDLGMKGPIWQRGYYDHIIRDERDADQIREYIVNNPLALKLKKQGLS